MREKSVSGAIQLRRRNDVVPSFGDIDKRVLDRGHPGADAKSVDAAFERGHAFFQHGVRGISDPGVDVPFDFQIEQSGTVLSAVKLESDSLIDGHSHGLRRGIAVVASVNGDGLSLHASQFSDDNLRKTHRMRHLSESAPSFSLRSGNSANGHQLGLAVKATSPSLCVTVTSRKICAESKPHDWPKAVCCRNPHEIESRHRRLAGRGEHWGAGDGSQFRANLRTQERQPFQIHLVARSSDDVISSNLAFRSVRARTCRCTLPSRTSPRCGVYPRSSGTDSLLVLYEPSTGGTQAS